MDAGNAERALCRRRLLTGGLAASGAALCASDFGASTGLRTALASARQARTSSEPVPLPSRPIRGMVVSCPMYGKVWGSKAMERTVTEVRGLGVDSVQTHPYARIESDGTVHFRPTHRTPYVTAGYRIIRSGGLAPFSKPHLAYWGRFSWRGEIQFRAPEAWERFFSTYQAFIVDPAKAAEAEEVPLFSVGTELEKTMAYGDRWKEVIAAVRRVYSGKLTYGANWDGVEQVPFWNELDFIGVQAYFPVAPHGSGPDRLRSGVVHWMEQLEKLSQASSRPVLLTEVGYPRSEQAAVGPWKPAVQGTEAAIRTRGLLTEAVLEEAERRTSVAGLYWWKWIPGRSGWDRDFSMKDPEMRRALQAAWGSSHG